MKVWLGSDLHVEYEQNEQLEFDCGDADVAVLAGDIGVGVGGIEWAARMFDIPVIYVSGNHEYYNQDLHEHTGIMRQRAAALGVYFLECDSVEINGVLFSGCTLWTDYQANENAADAMSLANRIMADHRVIQYGGSTFLPQDALQIHDRSKQWLAEHASGSRVIITHHGPSLSGLGSRHERNEYTPAFFSKLDALLYELKPELWIFGHTHDSVDVVHDCGTRLVSNQHGYPFESREEVGWSPGKVVELAAQG